MRFNLEKNSANTAGEKIQKANIQWQEETWIVDQGQQIDAIFLIGKINIKINVMLSHVHRIINKHHNNHLCLHGPGATTFLNLFYI